MLVLGQERIHIINNTVGLVTETYVILQVRGVRGAFGPRGAIVVRCTCATFSASNASFT